jgi:hypothetical protein
LVISLVASKLDSVEHIIPFLLQNSLKNLAGASHHGLSTKELFNETIKEALHSEDVAEDMDKPVSLFAVEKTATDKEM